VPAGHILKIQSPSTFHFHFLHKETLQSTFENLCLQDTFWKLSAIVRLLCKETIHSPFEKKKRKPWRGCAFWKVSAQVHLLYKHAIKRTFENGCPKITATRMRGRLYWSKHIFTQRHIFLPKDNSDTDARAVVLKHSAHARQDFRIHEELQIFFCFFLFVFLCTEA